MPYGARFLLEMSTEGLTNWVYQDIFSFREMTSYLLLTQLDRK